MISLRVYPQIIKTLSIESSYRYLYKIRSASNKFHWNIRDGYLFLYNNLFVYESRHRFNIQEIDTAGLTCKINTVH